VAVSTCEAVHVPVKNSQPVQRQWVVLDRCSAREGLYWTEEVNLRLSFGLGPASSRRLDQKTVRGNLNYSKVLQIDLMTITTDGLNEY